MASKKQLGIGFLIVALIVVGLVLGLVFGLKGTNEVYIGEGAIVSNGEGCAEIGGHILEQGGSAVDAAIAIVLCEGVVLPHSLGVGGGFVATIYSKKTGKVESLIARERAPLRATQDMFVNSSITGAISAAVPSEIFGFWEMHQKYGKLPWKTLYEPTIELCENGIRVSKYLANVLNLYRDRLIKEESMTEIFINPKTGDFFKEGEIMFRPQLAETLRVIAEEGVDAMYGPGKIGTMLVEDIQSMGGIMIDRDLLTYSVRWEEPITANFFGDYKLFTTPLPTSGAILVFMLNVMESMYTDARDVYWQRMIETFKHAYGLRTNLGDIVFEPEVRKDLDLLLDREHAAEVRKLILDNQTFTDYEYYGANFSNVEDHGTANVAVLSPDGDAISITSTINSHLGAKVRSRRTGIILNDQMDDFSTPGKVNTYGIPASPANFIKPYKIPMSSTCPSIVLDHFNNVRLLIGGAGGSRITTSVAQTILRYFVLNQTLAESVNSGRIHHQLAPMCVDIEPEVPVHIVLFLKDIGHALNFLPWDKAFSALTAIGLKNHDTEPICDIRRQGSTKIVHKKFY